MYSVSAYASMLADKPRMLAYDEALAKAVFPGAVVVDIGTGPGVMAMMACRHGAKRVYAIEPSPVIAAAREIVALNGLSDRITLIEGLSTEIELSERADVIVSDLRGVLPLFGHHVPTIVDARSRLLKQGGALIPRRDLVRIALVENEGLFDSHLQTAADSVLGFDLAPLHRLLSNSWRKIQATPAELMSEAVTAIELDYETITSPDATGTARLVVIRDGILHGVAAWLKGTLAGDVVIDSGPGCAELIYGQAFFPFPRPVRVRRGAAVDLEVQARLVGEDYVWRWKSTVIDAGGAPVRFDQSTFLAAPISAPTLARRAHTYRCTLSRKGELHREILKRMDGRRTNGEIAAEIAEAAGGQEQALDLVSRLADELGERSDPRPAR